MLRLLVFVSLVALPVWAQSRDGGTRVPELSAGACDKLEDHIILLSVNESLAADPVVQKMSPKERSVTEQLARREALADPKLVELKKACPARYDRKMEQCVLKSKTVKEVDACSK